MRRSIKKYSLNLIVQFSRLNCLFCIWGQAAFAWLMSGFGLRVILRNSLTDFSDTQNTVLLPSNEIKKLNYIILVRGIFNDNSLMHGFAETTLKSLTSKIRISRKPLDPMPLPEWRFGSESDELLQQQFIKTRRPVKIMGLECPANSWSLQYFLDNYGDKEVIFTDEKGLNFEAPLKLLKSVRNDGERLYVHNCGRILHKDDLDLNLNLDILEKLTKWQTQQKYQLFLGAYKGGGSPLHCAPSSNAFMQIEGSKLWTFVDPFYTYMLYPVLSSDNQFQTSALPHPIVPNDLEKFPLYFYAPRYQTVLLPGEILLVPSWWHHSVENLTETSVGIATRWLPGDEAIDNDTNHLYSLLLNSLRPTLYKTKIALSRNIIVERRHPNIGKYLGNAVSEEVSHDKSHHHRNLASIQAWGINY